MNGSVMDLKSNLQLNYFDLVEHFSCFDLFERLETEHLNLGFLKK